MNILIYILIGLAIGWVARIVLEDRGFGKKGNVVAGIAGALAGGLLFELLIVIVKTLAPAVAAIFGALFIVAVGNQKLKKK